MRERGRGGRRGCRAGERSEAAHSSPPWPPRAQPPLRGAATGEGPRSSLDPSPNRKTSPNSANQVARSPCGARGSPAGRVRAAPHLRRGEDNRRSLPRRRRLAAAAAEARSLHHRALGGVQALLPRLLRLRAGSEPRRPPAHAPQAARGWAVTPRSPPENKRGAKACELGLHDRAARQAP